jgi:hypothetical protein
MAGEAVLLGEDKHSSSVVCVSQQLQVLRIEGRELKKLMHSQDVEVRTQALTGCRGEDSSTHRM